MIAAQPEKQQEKPMLWTAPPETLEGESRAIFEKIEDKKKRWKSDMELKYDPVKDQFLDMKSNRPVHALLDGDEDAFFDENSEVDPQKFDSDNSAWIKRGGANALDMEKVLGVKLENTPSRMDVWKREQQAKLYRSGR
jgi:hypothetical protein